MVIVKTFMYRSHLDQISSSVDTSSAPCGERRCWKYCLADFHGKKMSNSVRVPVVHHSGPLWA